MGCRTGLIVAACALASAPGARGAEPERPALTVLLARPVAADGQSEAGSFSGAVSFDHPLRPGLAAVVVAGTSRGLAGDLAHGEATLDSSYLGVGVRVSADPEDATRLYLLGALGGLRADSRQVVGGFQVPERDLHEASTGATAVLAAGVVATIAHSRWSVVFEATYLAPWTSAPGYLQGKVPSQLLAAAGVRVGLGP